MLSVILMFLSVFVFSIYPLLAAMGLERNDPVLFVLVAHAGCAVFSLVYGAYLLRKKYTGKTRPKGIFSLDKRTWFFVLATGTAAAINHTCLMYAFTKTSKIGATMIYEAWPILAIWLAPLLVAKGAEKVRRVDYLFGMLAVLGAGFIISAGTPGAILNLDFGALLASDPDKLQGYGLAAIASIGVACSTMLRRRVNAAMREKCDDDLLLGVTLSSGLTRLATLPVFAVFYALLHEPGTATFVPGDLPLALGTGIAVYAMGSIFYVYSILRQPNPSIPIPDYLAPVMAILWLYLSGYDQVTDFAIIGALCIITANLLVTVRAEQSFAYMISILTLLVSGTYCYFSTGGMLTDFYEAVSVSAVFYAILVAFAWDRVIDRVKHEEALALDIAYRIEKLRQKQYADNTSLIRQLIADVRTVISTSDHVVIGRAYNKLRETKALLGTTPQVLRIFQDIDNLILSKTKDVMLSEVVLLCLIGGVTLLGVVGYRPPGLWPDLMAFIMAGAIVFIFFAIFDQLNERRKSVLSGTDDSLCEINRELFESHNEFKLVSIVLIMIMLAVFYGLFAYKYNMLAL